MWYRVELNKDGSVSSCTHVEGALRDGKHVRYVDAENAEAACKAAVDVYRAYVRRCNEAARKTRLRKAADGLCTRGGCDAPVKPGRKMCVDCLSHHAKNAQAYQAAKKAGTYVAPATHTRIVDRTPEQQLIAVARYEERRKARQDKRNGVYPESARRVLRTLQDVLARLDAQGPQALRVWLTGEIERLDAKRRSILARQNVKTEAA